MHISDESNPPDLVSETGEAASGQHAFLTRRKFMLLGGAGLLAVSPLMACGPQSQARRPISLDSGPLPWPAANTILHQTVVPTFPNRTFLLTNYGGKGDASTDNTVAFQKAIADCNAAGGGHVEVPEGVYVTGAIHLLSNVDLHLDARAVLMFSRSVSGYPLVLTRYEGIECINYSPMIYAYGQKNIALTGRGILDASQTVHWNKGANRPATLEPLVARGVPPEQRNVAGQLRSSFVQPYHCENVLLQGVTLRYAPFWQFHPTLCKNVTIDSVTTTVSGGNSDGCDPECCDHVVIKNSTFRAGDDTIAIKSGRDADGRRVNIPSQNIVIWKNSFEGPVGAISLGSELTGGIQNVYAYDNATIGSSTFYGLFVKSNTKRGGFVRNINIDTFHGSGIRGPIIFITTTFYNQTGNFPPDFSGPFNCNKLVVNYAPMVLDIEGLPNHAIGPVTLSNSTFTHIANPKNILLHVSRITSTNVTINGLKS